MEAPEAYVRRVLANTAISQARRSFLRHEVIAGPRLPSPYGHPSRTAATPTSCLAVGLRAAAPPTRRGRPEVLRGPHRGAGRAGAGVLDRHGEVAGPRRDAVPATRGRCLGHRGGEGMNLDEESAHDVRVRVRAAGAAARGRARHPGSRPDQAATAARHAPGRCGSGGGRRDRHRGVRTSPSPPGRRPFPRRPPPRGLHPSPRPCWTGIARAAGAGPGTYRVWLGTGDDGDTLSAELRVPWRDWSSDGFGHRIWKEGAGGSVMLNVLRAQRPGRLAAVHPDRRPRARRHGGRRGRSPQRPPSVHGRRRTDGCTRPSDGRRSTCKSERTACDASRPRTSTTSRRSTRATAATTTSRRRLRHRPRAPGRRRPLGVRPRGAEHRRGSAP